MTVSVVTGIARDLWSERGASLDELGIAPGSGADRRLVVARLLREAGRAFDEVTSGRPLVRPIVRSALAAAFEAWCLACLATDNAPAGIIDDVRTRLGNRDAG